MTEKKTEPKGISMTNTKQEMLEAYNALLKQLQEKSEAELKPEKKIEEKKIKEVVQVADSLSSEKVAKDISNLKMEIGRMLSQLSDGLEKEVDKYQGIQKAIEIREKEIQEIYEIERSAATLAALIESQHQKRQEFESEMEARKEELNREIQTTRAGWEKEKKLHEAETKERDAAEAKRREREKEEYRYTFEREQQLAKDMFEDEQVKLKREIQIKREEVEKDLAEREKVIAQSEKELNELRKRVSAFPEEMEIAVSKAIKETTEKIELEAKNREELAKKEFEGERNVLKARIESLEKTVKGQGDQITKLSEQLEKAYQKVQDIAEKAVEGSSNLKSFNSLQQLMKEQSRKQSEEK